MLNQIIKWKDEDPEDITLEGLYLFLTDKNNIKLYLFTYEEDELTSSYLFIPFDDDEVITEYLWIPYPNLWVKNAKKKYGKYISERKKNKIFSKFNYKCKKCYSKNDIQIDHILPYSLGGSNETGNLQALCKECNYKKFNHIE